MSEEKPTFKVTDRRLFNSDGSPRDIIREEEPPRPEPPAPAAVATPPAAEPPEPKAPPAVETAPAVSGERTEPKGAERESAAANEREKDAPAEAGDPQDFFMLVEFVASFAADALGMVNHPGGAGVNLPLAQQCIDMLGTLHAKTRGNISGEEQQFLDMILSQLRMQYVSLTTAPRPPQGGRGFTGGDITGGR